jgi:hypothetical protein
VSHKKVGLLMIYVSLLTFALSGIGRSAPEESRSVYHQEYVGLEIDVLAPTNANPGDSINVTIKTQAAVQSINVKYINVIFYGFTNATTKLANVTLGNFTHLQDSSLSQYEVEYNITIPDDISTGLTYGEISCEWEFMGAPQKILPSGFPLTYVKDNALEELQAKYDELDVAHNSTLEDYYQLEAKLKGEVDSARNLMYVFVATTIVAAITVGVLLVRKPKKVWV